MTLKKSLSTIEVFSFGAGSMISSGLFILPSLAYSEASGGMIIAYFLAGLLMLTAISVAACCVFTLLNILSVESSSRTQVVLVVFL